MVRCGSHEGVRPDADVVVRPDGTLLLSIVVMSIVVMPIFVMSRHGGTADLSSRGCARCCAVRMAPLLRRSWT
jgi:hypothetical protein